MTTSTRYVHDRFTTGPLPGLYSRNHYLAPCFDEPGDGGDAGAGGGAGDGGDGGAGDGGGAAFTGHTFVDDKGEMMLPGHKTPVKVADVLAAIQARDHHTKGLETMGEIAKRLKAADGRDDGQRRQQQQQVRGEGDGGDKKPSKSVLDKLDAMDLLDGKSVAGVLREYENGTVSPMLRAMVAMAKRLEAVEGHVGGIRGQGAEADFSNDVKSAIASLNLPRLDPNTPIEGEDILAEMVRDLYFSYDEKDQPKLKGEVLNKLVKDRHDAIMKYAKAYQKSELAVASKKARDMRFVRPGANVSGNGKPKKMLTNSQAASALFAGSEGANV